MRSVLSWRGWAVLARLSFGALLLHMLINKSLLASQLAATHLGRTTVVSTPGRVMYRYAA